MVKMYMWDLTNQLPPKDFITIVVLHTKYTGLGLVYLTIHWKLKSSKEEILY